MKINYKGTLISVKNIEKSKKFYMDLFNEEILMDLGNYVAFKSGLYLHSKFHQLISKQKVEIKYHGIDHELYYEVENFDEFLDKLNSIEKPVFLNKPYITPWNQNVVRIFDPDFHIIEIGESMDSIIARLLKEGKTKEEIVKITEFPLPLIDEIINKNS